ncbi:hypothetical protein JCGZ_22905 [Jatropha curcas]|uniref:Uncharacterized protein n=1 Tax=Jatropha curcas TaxID=180498 RepID=A0A067K0U2_JATCU|nr:hypothetical protein JCGZ_22905 [Jatropha curcas]
MAKRGPKGTYYLVDRNYHPLATPDNGQEPRLDMASPVDQPTALMGDSAQSSHPVEHQLLLIQREQQELRLPSNRSLIC